MLDTTVKYFDSTMSGAPTLPGTAGALVVVLTACLQDGFGSVTVDTLTVAGNLATATVSGGHQFAMIGTTGPVIRISGANPAALNVDHRITVTSPTQFTFPTTGLADQTATGTISAKRAPAGWTRAYNATHKAVFRADALAGTRLPLRVDDTQTRFPVLGMYETMSDVDTGTGVSPAVGTLYTAKSAIADASSRPWQVIADPRAVYVLIDAALIQRYSCGLFFGDVVSLLGADAYGCALIGHASGDIDSFALGLLNSASAARLARSRNQIAPDVPMQRRSHSLSGEKLGGGGSEYISTLDGMMHLWQVECWENATVPRGMMPGLWNPIHPDTPGGVLVENIPELPGRTLKSVALTPGSTGVFDLTGPWR